MMRHLAHGFAVALLACWTLAASAAQAPDALWMQGLKQNFFGERTILDGAGVIELQAPERAEDGAVVPLRITAGFAQSPQRYIRTIVLVIDKNPVPLGGRFHFTPNSGRADLALRIRVNEYSPVRAVAETNDGKLYMARRFVKASGGCSAPAGSDLDVAMQRLGRIRFSVLEDARQGEAVPARLAISHPNLTGMQKDQQTLLYIPAHFVRKVEVRFDGEPVFSAELDISVSENPNFRFFFVPQRAGELVAEIEDNRQMKFTERVRYSPPPAAR